MKLPWGWKDGSSHLSVTLAPDLCTHFPFTLQSFLLIKCQEPGIIQVRPGLRVMLSPKSMPTGSTLQIRAKILRRLSSACFHLQRLHRAQVSIQKALPPSPLQAAHTIRKAPTMAWPLQKDTVLIPLFKSFSGSLCNLQGVKVLTHTIVYVGRSKCA